MNSLSHIELLTSAWLDQRDAQELSAIARSNATPAPPAMCRQRAGEGHSAADEVLAYAVNRKDKEQV